MILLGNKYNYLILDMQLLILIVMEIKTFLDAWGFQDIVLMLTTKITCSFKIYSKQD